MRLAPRSAVVAGLLSAGVLSALFAHDMFLKLDSYFVEPNHPIRVPLINGTFQKSENAIDRARFADISVVGPNGRKSVDTTSVVARHDTTFLSIQTAASGTYVIGAATRPSQILLKPAEFIAYLKEEGLLEVIKERAARGEADKPARERYAKNVKAIVQVGETRSDDFGRVLGYSAEIVPLDNPYAAKPGAPIRFKCLLQGAPAVGITLLVGGRGAKSGAFPERTFKTDSAGVASVPITGPGKWFAKFINMKRYDAGEVNYESRWATVTFEVR